MPNVCGSPGRSYPSRANGYTVSVTTELEAAVGRAQWIEAKTYRDKAPHEYVIRGKTITPDDFSVLASAIRDRGYKARWIAVAGKSKGKTFTGRYLVIGSHRYWWMGSIINRAPL